MSEAAWPFLQGVSPPGSNTVPQADAPATEPPDQLAHLQALQVSLQAMGERVDRLERMLASAEIALLMQVQY